MVELFRQLLAEIRAFWVVLFDRYEPPMALPGFDIQVDTSDFDLPESVSPSQAPTLVRLPRFEPEETLCHIQLYASGVPRIPNELDEASDTLTDLRIW